MGGNPLTSTTGDALAFLRPLPIIDYSVAQTRWREFVLRSVVPFNLFASLRVSQALTALFEMNGTNPNHRL